MSGGLLFAWALLILTGLTAAYAVQGLGGLVRGALAAAGWALSMLACGLWAAFNRREAARLWRQAGRGHAAGYRSRMVLTDHSASSRSTPMSTSDRRFT